MNCRHRRFIAYGVVAAFIIACSAISGQAGTVEGIVFVDHNGNQVLDNEERGLPGVSVSD